MEYILGLLAHATTMEEIMEEYPGLEKDDIHACLLFASKIFREVSLRDRSRLGIACAVIPIAARERGIALKPKIPIVQTTKQSEPPLCAEFVAETFQAMDELDSRLGKTFSSKKEFLDDLE